MIKLYLKFFAAGTAAVIIALLLGGLLTLPPAQALRSALEQGLILGVLITAVLGTAQVLAVRRIAGGDARGDIYARTQRLEMKSFLPPERVFALVEHYLKELSGCRLVYSDQAAGKLKARSGISLLALGVTLTAEIRPSGNDASELSVVAAPSMPLALADYGAVLKLVRGLERHLRDSEHR